MRYIRNLLVLLLLGVVCVFTFWWAHVLVGPGARFLLYSGFYVVIGLTALRIYKGAEPLDPFAPILPSFLLLYLYSSASALNAQATGATTNNCPVDTDVMRIFYVSCLAGLTGLSAGFVAGKATKPVIRIPSGIPRRLSDGLTFTKLLWFAPLLGIVCFPWVKSAFDFPHVKSYGEAALADRVAKMQMGAGQPLTEVFLRVIPLALLLTLAVLLVFRGRHLPARIAGVVILLAYIATATLGGQRSALAMTGVMILVFINYRVRKISLATLAIVFISGFLMTNVISLVRSTNKPMEMVALVSESIARGDTSFLRSRIPGSFSPGRT